jgi:zinc D-Ala-D-Ala carboxypeptidase
MRLSEHFTLEELTRTSTGLPNEPDAAHGENLVRLCDTVLEPMRAMLGPLKVDSGFRTLAVNNAIPGAAHNSQHMLGQAADVVPLQAGLERAFQSVKASDIPYDQLIIEPTWLHVSVAALGATPRRQTLRAHRDGGRMVYEVA